MQTIKAEKQRNIKWRNERAIVMLLKQNSEMTIPEIAEKLELSRTAATKTITELCSEGLLKEVGIREATVLGGKPPRLYSLNASYKYTLILLIGNDHISTCIADMSCSIVASNTVTKPGLSVPVGQPSINPGPRQLIRNVVAEVLGADKISLEVTISIPAGVELAKQTLNPILGVEGGISVIGTTGVLRPMSEEGFKNSLVPQIDVAKAAGFDTLIFVPGKIGERLAGKWQLPAQAMVQTSNFIGFMLEAAQQREIKRVLLFGHIGKLVKVAAGCFYTHNRIADGRLETIAAYGAAEGLSTRDVQAVLNANTTEDALAVLDRAGLKGVVCQRLAERASLRAQRYLFQKMQIGTVMVAMSGELLGMDETAASICRDLGGEVLNGNAE